MRTLKIGATAPALRFYVADADGPVDLETGVTSLELEATGPEPFTATLTPDAGQTLDPPADGLTGVGWCSAPPDGTLPAGRYACIVTRITSDGTFNYPEDGYEVLEVQPGRNTVAAVADVKRRMGSGWDDAMSDQAGYLLTLVTGLIATAAGRTPTQVCDLEPIPADLTLVAVEAVVRVLFNPRGAQTTQETLGSYSHSETFGQSGPMASSGLMLTDREELRVRRAVHNASSGSVRVRSMLHDVQSARGVLLEDDTQVRLA